MASWAKWAHINHKEILGYHFADPIRSANYIDQVREAVESMFRNEIFKQEA